MKTTPLYEGSTKNGTSFTIRYPVPKDVKGLLFYINALSKEQTHIRFQGEQLTLAEEQKFLTGRLKAIDEKKAVMIVVSREKDILGVSSVDMSEKIESHVGIFGISLVKEIRGEGIGKLLMNFVLQESVKNIPELKILTLSAFASNERALTLYKKFGFKEYGRLPKGFFYKDGYVDHVYMYRNIEDRW